MKNDSTNELDKHIQEIKNIINIITIQLINRSITHDQSKYKNPEKEIFDEYTPKLKSTTYGSDEYKQYLKEMTVAINHHYANNRHHPEHFKNGINDMNLIDIVEMFSDWLTAIKKHDDGDIYKSIEINQKRFNYSDDLKNIFINTANFLKEK